MATDVYTLREVALAAGVPEARVVAILGRADGFVRPADAVRIGRALRSDRQPAGEHADVSRIPEPLFALFLSGPRRVPASRVPFAVSSTLHAGLVGVLMFITTLSLAPTAASIIADDERADPMRLVYLATPGPGGGGGGGGLLQKPRPPKALREGRRALSSPIPLREPPPPIVPAPSAPEPKPEPLNAEPLPTVVAPIMPAPADTRNRVGVLEETTAQNDSHGAGRGGGAGTGTGTGLGEGDGAGIGPGSGGGIGGGPYRPGSGIEPPRLLREVKADYSEDARQRNLSGDVVLEIVVRRDGSVGDIKVMQGLGSGLNERAVQAVRQWRFAPARRQGVPVDVIVEVAVEFKLR